MTNVSLAGCLQNKELLLEFREYCKLHRSLDAKRLSALVFLLAQPDYLDMALKNKRQFQEIFLNENAPKDICYGSECETADDFIDLKLWLVAVLQDAFVAFQKCDFFKLSDKLGLAAPSLKVRRKGVFRRPRYEHDSDEWFHMHTSGKKLTSI